MQDNTLHIFTVILLLSTAILLSSCQDIHTSYYADGTIMSEITMRDGRYNGDATFFYKNGEKQMECRYHNDTLEGKLIRYHSNGTPQDWIYYKAGRPDSLFRSWNPQGQLLLECMYTDSLLHGRYTDYYDNGQVKSSGEYNHGLFNGLWLFYNQTGYIIGKGDFSNGSGVRKAFHPNGNEKQVTRFENGLPLEEIIFDHEGNPVERKTFRKGKIIDIKTY